MTHRKHQLLIDSYGKLPSTLDEVAESCIAVIKQSHPLVGFAWDIKFAGITSNSHQSPINGVRNWGAKNDKPNGYPGFSGRVWVRYAESTDGFGSDCLVNTLTYPGTGGFGSYNGVWQRIATAAYHERFNDSSRFPIYDVICFSWDYIFFLEDFPALKATLGAAIDKFKLEQDDLEIWNKLKGKYCKRPDFQLHHKFLWEDSETKAADEEYMAMTIA